MPNAAICYTSAHCTIPKNKSPSKRLEGFSRQGCDTVAGPDSNSSSVISLSKALKLTENRRTIHVPDVRFGSPVGAKYSVMVGGMNRTWGL